MTKINHVFEATFVLRKMFLIVFLLPTINKLIIMTIIIIIDLPPSPRHPTIFWSDIIFPRKVRVDERKQVDEKNKIFPGFS